MAARFSCPSNWHLTLIILLLRKLWHRQPSKLLTMSGHESQSEAHKFLGGLLPPVFPALCKFRVFALSASWTAYLLIPLILNDLKNLRVCCPLILIPRRLSATVLEKLAPHGLSLNQEPVNHAHCGRPTLEVISLIAQIYFDMRNCQNQFKMARVRKFWVLSISLCDASESPFRNFSSCVAYNSLSEVCVK